MALFRLLKILWRVARVLAQLVWSIDEVAGAIKKAFGDDEEDYKK